MKRRGSRLALAVGCAWLISTTWGCGPKAAETKPTPPPTPLHLEPACDLAQSAGLLWVVEARPRALASIPDLIPVIARVIPEARFATFSAAHGGIDVRQITDLCVARYKETWLTVARAPLDPVRVEKAFVDRVTHAGGRSPRGAHGGLGATDPPVAHVWGEVNGEPQQLVLFGREAAVLEEGRPGPARTALAFARGILRRASPALRGGPLPYALDVLGEAPVRVLAPGPFEGEIAQGLGGLLRASTAVGASAHFAGAPAKLAVRLVLTGAWGKEAPAAAERLAAAVHVVSESAFGRLLGLHEPVAAPQVRATDEALVLDVTVDGVSLAEGIHDALDAEIGDIMRGSRKHQSPVVPRFP